MFVCKIKCHSIKIIAHSKINNVNKFAKILETVIPMHDDASFDVQ